MTKTHLLRGWGGRDHIADLYLLSSHHDAINQQLDELPFLFKGRLSEALLHPLAESFNGLDHAGEFIVPPDIDF
jgi:hypothetical protein